MHDCNGKRKQSGWSGKKTKSFHSGPISISDIRYHVKTALSCMQQTVKSIEQNRQNVMWLNIVRTVKQR